jgi:GNAT superfamily N-acetyltransferase
VTSRPATPADVPLLAELNHQLIRDERHRNDMTVPQLAERMKGWMATGEYVAQIFESEGEVVAYALFREQPTALHLRQFFVQRHRRAHNFGRQAMQLLLENVWPGNKRRIVEVLSDNAPALAFYRALGFADYSVTMEILPSAPAV